jgi:hypothetical protein
MKTYAKILLIVYDVIITHFSRLNLLVGKSRKVCKILNKLTFNFFCHWQIAAFNDARKKMLYGKQWCTSFSFFFVVTEKNLWKIIWHAIFRMGDPKNRKMALFLPATKRNVPPGLHFALLLLLLLFLLLFLFLFLGSLKSNLQVYRPTVDQTWSNMIRHDQKLDQTQSDTMRHDETRLNLIWNTGLKNSGNFWKSNKYVVWNNDKNMYNACRKLSWKDKAVLLRQDQQKNVLKRQGLQTCKLWLWQQQMQSCGLEVRHIILCYTWNQTLERSF